LKFYSTCGKEPSQAEVEKENKWMEKASHNKLHDWAIKKVEDRVDQEASVVSSDLQMHARMRHLTWDFIHNFSFASVIGIVQKAPPYSES
jgi:hypothetical protein